MSGSGDVVPPSGGLTIMVSVGSFFSKVAVRTLSECIVTVNVSIVPEKTPFRYQPANTQPGFASSTISTVAPEEYDPPGLDTLPLDGSLTSTVS